MDQETTITKGSSGWRATTFITLGPAKDQFGDDGERRLCIETHKAVSGGGMLTRASVSLHKNGMYSHAFGYNGQGDYSKRVIQSAARCTEKAVGEQHAQALSQAPALLEEAKAHYAAQEAKKAEAVPA